MPLASERKLNDGTVLGIWDISESLEQLLSAQALTAVEADELQKRPALQKQKQFLAARMLLMHMLGKRNPIHYLPDGRPFIPGSPLQVSVSHSGNYAAVAASDLKPVGVDIEVFPRKSLVKAKDYFLNDKEQQVTAGDPVEKLHVYWSAKEALFKYAGDAQLNLKDHFSIAPFLFSASGVLSASIRGEPRAGEVDLSYWLEADYILVVTGT